MKRMLILLIVPLALIGCEPEPERYEWVIERGSRPSQDVQRDFNTMGLHGWSPWVDGDLEQSGHYVYFTKRMTPEAARTHLADTFKALNAHLEVPE